MDILVNFSDQELARIDSITVEKRYSTGAVIIREGDTADALYLLAKGRISIYLTLPGGGASGSARSAQAWHLASYRSWTAVNGPRM